MKNQNEEKNETEFSETIEDNIEVNRRKDLHKYYKYVHICLGCKKKYGADVKNKVGYCSECSGKMRSPNFHKLKGGI